MAAAVIAIAARQMIRATGPMCCSLPGAASAVAEIDGPGGEAPRLLELKLHARVQRREEGRAPTGDDGMDDGLVLVDQVELHERGGQIGAADADVPLDLLLELGDRVGDGALRQRRVAPDGLERAREHDLRRVLPDPRE